MNNRDFTILNGLIHNRKGDKYDAQAFPRLLKNHNYKIPYKNPRLFRIHNHLEDNYHLNDKKSLFYNMRAYYETNNQNVFTVLPLTFHIQKGKADVEYTTFVNHFNSLKSTDKSIWIVKPGEITNRGFGIKVLSDLPSIERIIETCEFDDIKGCKTYIIQKYIENPLLYQKRKFDIRCYYLLTTTNGYLKGYWYEDGYIRTASKEFTINNLSIPLYIPLSTALSAAHRH